MRSWTLPASEQLRPVAYIDEDLPLGSGRYLMEPMIAGRLLQEAAIARTDAALIVGAGTGYEAVLAAMLARSVLALEEDPELARRARAAGGGPVGIAGRRDHRLAL